MFYRTGVIADFFFIAGIGVFDLFGSCDLDLDPMTLVYELDPYSLEIYRLCKNELLTSRLSKVIVLETDRGTHHRNCSLHAVSSGGQKY